MSSAAPRPRLAGTLRDAGGSSPARDEPAAGARRHGTGKALWLFALADAHGGAVSPWAEIPAWRPLADGGLDCGGMPDRRDLRPPSRRLPRPIWNWKSCAYFSAWPTIYTTSMAVVTSSPRAAWTKWAASLAVGAGRCRPSQGTVMARRESGLFPAIADFTALREAALRAARGEPTSREWPSFSPAWKRRCCACSGNCWTSAGRTGCLHRVHRAGEQAAPDFRRAVRDRVVHHALCAVIGPLFERGFIRRSYASRKGRGTSSGCRKL